MPIGVEARSPSTPVPQKEEPELTDVTVISGFHAAKRRRRDAEGTHHSQRDATRKKPASRIGLSDLADVASLAVPSLGAVLADPLISLVDTACVGQVSSVQLASLGPNTAVFNLIFQVCPKTLAELQAVAWQHSEPEMFVAHCLSHAGVCIPERHNHKCTGNKLPSSPWDLGQRAQAPHGGVRNHASVHTVYCLGNGSLHCPLPGDIWSVAADAYRQK